MEGSMKALTITQPWASLIATGEKVIETRSWRTGHRGQIAIHAAKGFPVWARETCADEPFLSALRRHGLIEHYGTKRTTTELFLPTAAIVAVADLAWIILTGDKLNHQHKAPFTVRGPVGQSYEMTAQEYEFGNFEPGRYGWVLKNVQRLDEPIACKGALGLWTLPSEIATRLEKAA